ncbi:MAG TPA: carboxypeptidase regulatory-like domain-containing protein [Blastocatellia bacterium]|nr:carboxypeptidase regulatory-like domain-containing protein [Blastocatellia bacterium]
MKQKERKRSTRLGRLVIILFAMAALFGLSGVAIAQIDQAGITGAVHDQNKAVVTGATVTIRNERTGDVRTATTKEDGSFTVVNLKPSTYTVTVTAQNFAKTEFTFVELVVGQDLNLDVELKPAGASESVTIVGGDEAALDTSSARMGANVNEAEVKGLPLNGRQLSQLYLQAPGALNSGSGTFGDIRFSGRAVEQNAVRYDGVEGSAIIDASPGNLNGEIASPFRLQASLENVQEFRVESSSYPAEYGTGTGGQVSVVTKSGGNRFHGSVFEFLRNDKLDSRNFFDRDFKSPLRLNQFGASLGGPIVKDRFFFFGSYEGYRLRSGINIVEGVPKLSRCATAVAAVRPICENAFLAQGAIRIVTDPNSSPDFDIGQLLASNSVNENSGALRLDYKINDKNSFYARFFRDDGDNNQPQNVSGARATYDYVPQNAVAAWQTTIGAATINEFKLGYNSAYTRVAGIAPTISGIDLSAVTINLAGSIAISGIAGQGNSAGLSIPGGLFRLNSATNGRGAPYTPYTIGLIDNLSWLRGNHSLKVGGEVRLIRLYTDRLGGTTYSYSNLASFLTNTAATVQYNGDVSSPSPFNNGATGNRFAKQEYYIGFVQDEWKVKPNLTFNYGLRYEYYSPLREDKDLQVVFDIDKGAILPSNTTVYKGLKTNFAPRLSVAWSPYQNGSGFIGGGKTVIRAGFGINYGPGQTEDQIQPIESDRISSTLSNVTNAFPANIATIVANFSANPNNRNYQPRAYDLNNYRVPERIFSYTASLQQELPYKMALTLAYVGSQGRNLFLRSVANQITQVLTNVNPANAAIVIREFSIVTPGAAGQNPTVQNPFAEVDYKRSGGHDSYNALQVSLARRFNTGLTLNAQYTYGTSRGNTAGSNEATTVGNLARKTEDFDYDDGFNNFDVRQTFNVSAIYALPFGKNLSGVGKTLLGGWELGTIMNSRSGLPMPVQITRPDILYVDAAGIYYGGPAAGRTAVINTPGGGNTRNVRRPDLLPGVDPFLNKDRTIINPAAFAIPKPGTFGNLERNSLHGPSFFQQDLIVAKKFAFTEGVNLEFRSEFFNIFNGTNFANPPAQLPSTFAATGTAVTLQPGQPFTAALAGSAFGVVNRTVERTVGLGTNRQVQFALRLNF